MDYLHLFFMQVDQMDFVVEMFVWTMLLFLLCLDNDAGYNCYAGLLWNCCNVLVIVNGLLL